REWSTAESGGASQDERLLGLYVEGEVTAFRALTLTGGVRNDEYSSFGHAATYRFTGAWRVPGSDTKLRGSFGTGFMPPSLDARFGSVFQKPNPAIRAERSRGWDAGVDQGVLGGRATLGATYFRNALRDLIGFQGAVYPELGMSVNVDPARHRQGPGRESLRSPVRTGVRLPRTGEKPDRLRRGAVLTLDRRPSRAPAPVTNCPAATFHGARPLTQGWDLVSNNRIEGNRE